MAMRRSFRRLLAALYVTLGVCMVLPLAAYVFAQSELGRGWIADQVSQLASDGDIRINVSGLGENFPFSIMLDRVTAIRNGQRVADIRNLKVSWRPWALMSRIVYVEAFTVASAEFVAGGGGEAKAHASGSGGFSLPVDVLMDRVKFDRITLAGIGDERAEMSLAGQLRLRRHSRQIAATIEAQRLDKPGHIRAVLKHRASPAQFELQADIFDAEDGLIGALAGMPGLPPIEARINGSGPAEDWRGNATMNIGGSPLFNAKLNIAAGAETRVAMASSVQTGTILSQEMSTLVGAKATLSAILRLSGQSEVSLDSFDVVSERLNLNASGKYTLPDGAISATALLTVGEWAPSPLLAGVTSGGLEISATLSGGIQAPRAVLSGSVRNLSSPGVASIAKLEFSGSVSASEGFSSIRFDNRLSAEDTRILSPNGAVERFASSVLTLSGDVRDLRMLTIESASLVSPLLTVKTSRGDIDFTTGGLKIVVDATLPKLASVPGLRPHLADGAMTVNSEIGGNLITGRFDATTAGRITGLKPVAMPLPSELAILDYSGQVRTGTGTGTGLEMTALQLDSEMGSLFADGTFYPGTGQSAVRASGTVPKLAALSAVLGTPVSGGARFDVEYVGKSIQAGAGKATVFLDRPVAGPASLEAVKVVVSAVHRESGSAGNISVGLTGNGKTVTGRTSFRASTKAVRLEGVRIVSDIVSGQGNITIALKQGRVSGSLALETSDLGALVEMAGIRNIPASGALSAEFRSSKKMADALDFEINGRSAAWTLEQEAATLDRFTLTGSVIDISGKPTGKALLKAQKLRFGDHSVDMIAANVAAGAAESIDFTVAADGAMGPGNTVALSGQIATRPDGMDVQVSKLDGSIGTYKLAFKMPARLKLSDTGTIFDLPGILVGDGQIGISGATIDGEVSAQASVKMFPLALANEIGIAPVAGGSLNLTAKFSGLAVSPDVELATAASGIRFVGRDAADLPLLSAQMTSAVRKGVFTAQAEISALKLQAFKLHARAGSGAISVFNFDDRTPVELRIDGGGPLGPLMEAVLPVGDRGSGNLKITLAIGGSMSAPDVKGTMVLSDVNYENGLTGAQIRDMNAEFKANGHVIQIVSLRGSDGRNGTFNGSGQFDIGSLAAIAGKANVDFSGFRIAHRDDAVVDASGKFNLAASGKSIDVAGVARIDSADILIPDKLPDAIYDLDVEEIRGGKVVNLKKHETRIDSAVPINLDVTFDIPGRVFVRGRGLQSEWKGKIRATGPASNPVIAGQLAIANGSFAFAGKKFAIREARITLPPGKNPDPQLFITADTKAGGIVAKVTVEGPASLPKFSVSSDPTLPREEVLSRILFGKTSAHLSPVQAAQLAESAATISGTTGSVGIFDRMRRATGLDVLDVETNGASATGSTLKAGKYVADGVFVSAGQGLTPGSGKVGVEIEVTPYLSLETEAGSSADSSVGVNLKYDF